MAAILKVAMFLAIGCSFWWCVIFSKKNPPQKKNPALNPWVFPSCSWIPSQKNHSSTLVFRENPFPKKSQIPNPNNPPDPSTPHKADIDPRSFWSCGILLVEFRWTFLREIFRTDIHGWTAVVWLEERGGNGLNQGAVEILKINRSFGEKKKRCKHMLERCV